MVWLEARSDRLHFRADPRRVAYHPPCHHTHAQGIVEQPLRLLDRVPGLRRVSLPHAQLCCGSAGSFSLHEPRLARRVREEKLDAVDRSGCELLLSSNPGCELFVQQGLEARGRRTVVQSLAVYLAERLDPTEGPAFSAGLGSPKTVE